MLRAYQFPPSYVALLINQNIMITKTNKTGFNNFSKSYFFQEKDRDGGISEKQRRRLVDYILSIHNDSDDEKEEKIRQLDDMSYWEADDLLCSVSQWQ